MKRNINPDVNLDDDELFKYVLELNELEKDIKCTDVEYPKSFGMAVEPFRNVQMKRKKQKSPWNTLFVFLCVIILIFLIVMCICDICNKKSLHTSNSFNPFISPMNIMPGVQQYGFVG